MHYRAHVATNSLTGSMQRCGMVDRGEHVGIAELDVVRSTQFVDDLTHGVCISSTLNMMHDLCGHL